MTDWDAQCENDYLIDGFILKSDKRSGIFEAF